MITSPYSPSNLNSSNLRICTLQLLLLKTAVWKNVSDKYRECPEYSINWDLSYPNVKNRKELKKEEPSFVTEWNNTIGDGFVRYLRDD